MLSIEIGSNHLIYKGFPFQYTYYDYLYQNLYYWFQAHVMNNSRFVKSLTCINCHSFKILSEFLCLNSIHSLMQFNTQLKPTYKDREFSEGFIFVKWTQSDVKYTIHPFMRTACVDKRHSLEIAVYNKKNFFRQITLYVFSHLNCILKAFV